MSIDSLLNNPYFPLATLQLCFIGIVASGKEPLKQKDGSQLAHPDNGDGKVPPRCKGLLSDSLSLQITLAVFNILQ